MAEGPDKSSQTEAPSQKRIDDARAKGDVAKSPDVPAFAALAAAAGVLLIGGGGIANTVGARLLPFIAHPDQFDFSGSGGQEAFRLALSACTPAAVVMLAALGAGVAGNVLQQGILWSPGKLAPDVSKLNPLTGLGRLFGIDSLAAFVKSFAKLLAVCAVTWMVLKPRATSLQELAGMAPEAVLPFSVELLRSLLIAVLAVFGVTAGLDWFWQRQRFMTRMKMSREELKQENKDAEGDPHIKGKLKQQRYARAKQRMIQAVPSATVVVMNPTHYAVALKYVQGEDAAPLCVAKGVDALALNIRRIAEENGVAVIEDPPLARALYAAMDVDDSIPREHYEAVAKVIGFVLNAGRSRPAPKPAARPEARPT